MDSVWTNLKRLWALLTPSHKDIGLVAAYTVFIGVFFLAVPLTAQGLIGSLASGIFNQPILVLGVAVLTGLILVGLLRVLQLQLVEFIQQKVFLTTAMSISSQLLSVSEVAFKQRYAPEVLNRFFDVLTIQKTLAKLLLDGPASVLQIMLGMLLISFYSPWFLLFNITFLVGMVAIFMLGYGGYSSSLDESAAKYRVAQWLEEMGQSRISFKMNGAPSTLLGKTDGLLHRFLDARQRHFRVVVRQSFANFMLEAMATAGVLMIGGWLVMNGQLSLGQLVASEIVILLILSATDKLVQYLESGYDLLAAVDKVHQVLRFEQERVDGTSLPDITHGLHLKCHNITFGYRPEKNVVQHLSLNLPPQSHTSVVGPSGMGKSTLAGLICGLHDTHSGQITLNDVDIRQYKLPELRKAIALVGDGYELFEGTVEDNILLGLTADELPQGALAWAIDMVMMARDLRQYPHGLQHRITTAGTNISLGQRHRILMARAIVQQPKLLILDEAFTGMDEQTKLGILEKLFSSENPWTILNISHDAEIVQRTDMAHVLIDGNFAESGPPEVLAKNVGGQFSLLFPDLSERLSGNGGRF